MGAERVKGSIEAVELSRARLGGKEEGHPCELGIRGDVVEEIVVRPEAVL